MNSQGSSNFDHHRRMAARPSNDSCWVVDICSFSAVCNVSICTAGGKENKTFAQQTISREVKLRYITNVQLKYSLKD